MGRYITHEQLPFKGKLVKIRMRRYGFSNVASQLQNEEELLEITPDGIVKLSATRISSADRRGRSVFLSRFERAGLYV